MSVSTKKTAKEIMKTEVVKVLPETPVKEVAQLMLATDISGFPVVDGQGKVLGVVTELDLMRKQIAPNEPSIWTTIWGMDADRTKKYQDARRKYMAQTAGEVMTSPAMTVDVTDNVEKVANIMFNKQIKRLFVTDGERLAGVISRSAFTKLLLDMEE
ncbi:MAG: CBS domain-containing protein [Acidaminococcaceae bacterium]|nr:CBS domain-containing protein [Acidaminococcaceae bacterium]MBR1590947.1 CBS domain-containing protein [Acidaminococcaceae bacterium]